MLLSCAQGPLGWRLAQAAEGLRALREAGVDLEMAKNLGWHRAGRQRANLAAKGSTKQSSFSPCLAGRGDCCLPQELWEHLGLAGVKGWDAHGSCQRLQVLLLWDARAPPGTGSVPNLSWGTGGSSLASAGGSNAPSWQLLVTRHINRQECANIQRSGLCKAAVVAPVPGSAADRGRTPLSLCRQTGMTVRSPLSRGSLDLHPSADTTASLGSSLPPLSEFLPRGRGQLQPCMASPFLSHGGCVPSTNPHGKHPPSFPSNVVEEENEHHPPARPPAHKTAPWSCPVPWRKAPAPCPHIPPIPKPSGNLLLQGDSAMVAPFGPQYVPAPWWPKRLAQSRGSLSCSPHSGGALSKQ